MIANKSTLTTADTFWQLLEKRAVLSPDQVLLIEGDYKQRKATVLECKQQAEALASKLVGLGVKEGTVVAWQMPTRLDTLILFLALARLGAVQNPILHLFRENELQAMLSQTQPSFFVVPPADETCDYPAQARFVSTSLNDTQVLVLDNDYAAADISQLPPPPPQGDEVRWLYCTSGTTSGPKAVKHTDKSLMAGGHALAVSLGGTSTDVHSIAYPVAHIGGAMMLGLLLELGIPAVIVEKFDIKKAAVAFRQHGVTITGGSTAHYQAWLALQATSPDEKILPSLRMLTGGGASKPPQYYFQVLEDMGVPIVHAYGMTECPLVASNLPDSGDHALAYTDGKPVAGMEVRIQRADGREAALGEVGEVLIRGECLCQGYLNPEQTEEAFDEDGFFHTGDLASMDESGYISLSGRLKDIIIRKGENISAREIEELLLSFPDIDGVAVIGLPDEASGERVCAVIEGAKKAISLSDVTSFLAAKGLMKQKWPEQLEVVDRLPRSEALGKVSKKALQAQFTQP